MGQLAFDLDELVREDLRANAGAWQGAPLHFTTDYYPPGELVAAFQHWQLLHGNFGSILRSHMWHPDYFYSRKEPLSFSEHSLVKFSASLSPEREHEGPGTLLHMAVCEPCAWHDASDSENDVVEVWHDHAVPGWRDLPVIPAQIRVSDERGLTPLARKWIAAHYPSEMQVPGAPIITERQRYATRHVEGRSPWGGYDLSSTALTRAEPPHPGDVPRPEPASLQAAAPDRASAASTPPALSR